MRPTNPSVTPTDRQILLIAAAPIECAAIIAAFGSATSPLQDVPPEWHLLQLDSRFQLLRCGIGKANAAGAAAHTLNPATHSAHSAYSAAINLGIAGVLPSRAPRITEAVLASHSLFADDGVRTPTSFDTCAQIGFPISSAPLDHFPAAPLLHTHLADLVEHIGPIATVSTCSGTDDLASSITSRTNALAEAMEGAAIALVAHRFSVPFAELRIVSNTTGNRPSQTWDIPGALARLRLLTSRLRTALAQLSELR